MRDRPLYEIWVVAPDGFKAEKICEYGVNALHDVSFSHDGRVVACAAIGHSDDRSFSTDIWLLRLFKEGPQKIFEDSGILCVALSPKGTRIAFGKVEYEPSGAQVPSYKHSSVWILDVASGEAKKILGPFERPEVRALHWFSSGDKLLIVGSKSMFIAKPDGSEMREIFPGRWRRYFGIREGEGK